MADREVPPPQPKPGPPMGDEADALWEEIERLREERDTLCSIIDRLLHGEEVVQSKDGTFYWDPGMTDPIPYKET